MDLVLVNCSVRWKGPLDFVIVFLSSISCSIIYGLGMAFILQVFMLDACL